MQQPLLLVGVPIAAATAVVVDVPLFFVLLRPRRVLDRAVSAVPVVVLAAGRETAQDHGLRVQVPQDYLRRRVALQGDSQLVIEAPQLLHRRRVEGVGLGVTGGQIGEGEEGLAADDAAAAAPTEELQLVLVRLQLGAAETLQGQSVVQHHEAASGN